MRNLIKVVGIGLFLIVSPAFAGGKIIGVNFSGPDDAAHPNIIQIRVEGWINSGDCDVNFAAIRNTEDRKHLVSFALTAFATNKPIDLVLNANDKYYGNRCTISRISSAN